MVRSFLIYLSKAGWARRIVTQWKLAKDMASRFISGETSEDALRVVKDLNSKGINATLDHLGESTTTPAEANSACKDIQDLLDQIEKAGVRANVSIKLTQIGLALDEKLCADNLEKILAHARKLNNFIRMDIEDTPFTEKTFQLFKTMKDKGYQNFGVALQSYLYRSEKDVHTLLVEGARIRLVKGAYNEPPSLAFPKKADVDKNYDTLASIIMDAIPSAGSPSVSSDGRTPPILSLGSHDPKRIDFAIFYSQRVGVPKEAIEFQMLYGIRRDLQEYCHKQGYPVRIYIPYGTSWYPYLMRRLAERPANLWFFVSNFFHK